MYIDSSTRRDGGVSRRLPQYDTKVNLPRYVTMAVEDGYVIVHRGLLCWA